ncbi:SUKH-4 family immunity protein [Streptomyces sp. NPDC020742]|uniref:SUKH-4 family immunity protein n=1 Tax=Streptomyces sp. NPDC020742 TaxID=3154897 RepID=UPI0033C12035
MVTYAQAQERAERWVNGEVPAPQQREVRVREFDLGFVCWAEDREGGPAADAASGEPGGGRVRLVIARDSGETTLWPGLPVGEVIRRYEEEYGTPVDGGSGAAEPPPQRIDLEATSFLLTPPEWLQQAADARGAADRRSDAGTGAGTGPVAPAAPAPAEPVHTSTPPAPAAPDAWAGVSVNGAGDTGAQTGAGPSGAPGGAGDASGWAAADTTGTDQGADDRSVGLPQTVFAPPLAGFDGEDGAADAPRSRPEAKTELLQGGSQLPRTQVAPALDLPEGAAPAGGPAGAPAGGPLPPPMPSAPPAAPGLSDLPPPSGPPAADVPPPPGTAGPGAPVPPAPPVQGGPGGGGVHAAATMLADGSSLPGNAAAGPPPPPGVPGAGRAGGPQDPADRAAAAPATSGGPAASGPGAPAGGYVPTQLVSQLDAADLDLSAVDGPGGPGGASSDGPSGGTPAGDASSGGAPSGGPAPGSGGPGGGVHAAATMLADGAALQAGPGGVGGPAGGPGGPGVPPPPPPGVPGAPKPPGPPGKPGVPGGGQAGPPPPPTPPAQGGPGAGGVHAAATMLAGGAVPGPPGPGAPGVPGMPPPAPAPGPGAPPPGVPGPPPGMAGAQGPGGAGAPGAPGAYGYPQAPTGQPTVGPGYMAVLSYRAPDGSEQKIVRRSAPGTPHPEWQLLHELRGMNVPPQQVLELHTELECCDLPGGYCARMIRDNWPQVRISHTAAYGRDHASRQQGVRHLVEHQGELHQVADGPARPAPVRVPLPHPSQVQPMPPVPPQVIGQELEQAFGPQAIFRFDQRAVSRHGVPDVVAQMLVWAGLPVEFGPFFWAQAQPHRPVPTLAELAAERGVQPAPDAGSYLVMGNDFGRQLCVQYGTANIVAVPLEGAAAGAGAAPQFVNSGLPEFVRCLAMLGRMWRLRYGLTPEQAGRWTVDFQAQLVALDAPALGSPETWWSVLLEQMWDGLL